MVSSLRETRFNPGSTASSQGSALFSTESGNRAPLEQLTNYGTRSRLEVGTFGQSFSSSGSVNRQFPDVFRFSLSQQTRLRIYVGNEFTNTRNNSQRMTVDLIGDGNLRRITGVTVNPTGINAITRRLGVGTYRIRISTQSSSRGRYFLDMVRL